jgi:RNA polymerase sigma-70 factor (ECF subfamily)
LPQTAPADSAPAAEQPDERLVESCRDTGNEAAFAELVRRYQRPVFRIAISILGQGCVQEAEDVAQDVMVRVHHALRTFRAEAKFSTWIYRIAFNQALNVKARMRHRAPHLGEDALAAAASAERAADDRIHAEQRRQAVLACMHELPEVYQSALRLHYWMGESIAAIADMLDTPENTIKSYLFRSRQLLHAMLIKRGFDAR